MAQLQTTFTFWRTIPNHFNFYIFKQLFLSDEGPMLETLDHTIRIGSTPTFLYFDLYLYSAYAAHYVYFIFTLLSSLYSLFTL